MMAKRLDGRAAADRLLVQLRKHVRRHRRPIRLATILVGQRYDSALYVRLKIAAAKRVGIKTEQHHLSERTTMAQLHQLIHRLNQRSSVNGILLQLPLPKHLNADAAVRAIQPSKDVDGFHPDNHAIQPPPVAAVLALINLGKPRRGGRAIILGRRTVYTEQLKQACEERGWPTKILGQRWQTSTKRANIIVTVLGRGPKLMGPQIQPGCIIVDVGIRHQAGHTVGDVDSSAWPIAKAISPVPGGVGPLTVAFVLSNTYLLARQS